MKYAVFIFLAYNIVNMLITQNKFKVFCQFAFGIWLAAMQSKTVVGAAASMTLEPGFEHKLCTTMITLQRHNFDESMMSWLLPSIIYEAIYLLCARALLRRRTAYDNFFILVLFLLWCFQRYTVVCVALGVVLFVFVSTKQVQGELADNRTTFWLFHFAISTIAICTRTIVCRCQQDCTEEVYQAFHHNFKIVLVEVLTNSYVGMYCFYFGFIVHQACRQYAYFVRG